MSAADRGRRPAIPPFAASQDIVTKKPNNNDHRGWSTVALWPPPIQSRATSLPDDGPSGIAGGSRMARTGPPTPRNARQSEADGLAFVQRSRQDAVYIMQADGMTYDAATAECLQDCMQQPVHTTAAKRTGYSATKTALTTPSCPGLDTILHLPSSVSKIAPLVITPLLR